MSNNNEEKDNKKKINDEAIKKFDEIILQHAKYMTDEEYNNSTRPEIVDIEQKLEPLNKDNDKISVLIDKYNDFDRPPLLFKNNNFIYKGMWNISAQKEGFGILIDKDGNKYVGGWKGDNISGYGRIISKEGDYYEGEWKNGIIEGNGKYYSNSEKYTYTGSFKNFTFHGKGKIVYDNNTIYEGNFENGYKMGEGKLTFEDGSYYEGIFKLLRITQIRAARYAGAE